MKGKLIFPPDYETIEGPLIFLAGPIQGAYKWQDQAIDIIQLQAPEVNIASPRRSVSIKKDFTRVMFEEQVDWETHHLRKAGEKGAVLFWLAEESEHYCERAYAQTSRFELGEWKMRHERDKANLVVGIEYDFSGKHYIERRLPQDCPDVPICSTLEETCKKAIEYCRL